MRPLQSVEIILDRPRSMRLDMLALFHAEKEINRIRGNKEKTSIFSLIQREIIPSGSEEDSFRAPIDLILVLFWASLLHEDRELTFENACKITGDSLSIISKVLETLRVCVLSPSREDNESPEVDQIPLARPNGLN